MTPTTGIRPHGIGPKLLAGVVACALLGALTGCVSVPLGATVISDQQAESGGATAIQYLAVPADEIPARYYSQRVDWSACGPDRCGFVEVPLDWSDPRGASIRIALMEHVAPGDPLGTVVVDPGGPGGSGVDLMRQGVDAAVTAAVAGRYNVVGFDPRGVGASTAVKCLSAHQLDKYIFAPAIGAVGSDTWIEDQEDRASTFANACIKNTGALLANVDTVSVAHDLDVIRSALGQARLNYIGYSWGTYLGTVYAGLYPSRVGRMVLDGAFDPWAEVNQDGTAQAVGFEGDLDSYLRSCVANKTVAVGASTCPFTNGYRAAEASVKSMLTAADRYPLAAAGGLRLDGQSLATAIIEALYSPHYWVQLTRMFAQLTEGVTTEAMVFLDARYDRLPTGVYFGNLETDFLAVGCLEGDDQVNIPRDAEEFTTLEKLAPIFAKYQSYGDLRCDGWPDGPSPWPAPIEAAGTGPILVIGTTGDPATPYLNAVALANQLAAGHLVTYHGEGHTAYDKGHACVDAVVDAYLLRGRVPSKDPNCH